MSVVDQGVESLRTIVDTAQQLRWVRLSALVLVTWDHSKSCFSSWSAGRYPSATEQLPLVICLDKEVHSTSTLSHIMCIHVLSLLD